MSKWKVFKVDNKDYIYCPNCGFSPKETSKYCPYCGEKMFTEYTPVRYQKKPVIIEAMCLTDSTADSVYDWVVQNHPEKQSVMLATKGVELQEMIINTLEGPMHASPGDYIIRGVHGEFYPCKPDIFHETYDFIGDSN